VVKRTLEPPGGVAALVASDVPANRIDVVKVSAIPSRIFESPIKGAALERLDQIAISTKLTAHEHDLVSVKARVRRL
jgi:hypothetical protein